MVLGCLLDIYYNWLSHTLRYYNSLLFIFLLASCKHVPDVCRAVYRKNATVHVTGNSYPVEDLSRDCFPNTQDRCYEVWRTVVCHLAYPECIEAQESNKIHGSRPLCKSYCNEIKNITSNCGFPSQCDQSLFIHNINCAGLPDRDCISAGE